MSYNKVILSGNLTRDPELRYTGSGTAICKLGLAVNEKFKTQTGELKEKAVFVDVTVWAKKAEVCNNYLKKGSKVLVDGKLELETWTDKESGANRSKHSINANEVVFMDSKPKSEFGGDDLPPRQETVSAPAPVQNDFAANSEVTENIPF